MFQQVGGAPDFLASRCELGAHIFPFQNGWRGVSSFELQHDDVQQQVWGFNTEARPGGAHFGASTQRRGVPISVLQHGTGAYFCASTRRRGASIFALQFRGAGRLLLCFNAGPNFLLQHGGAVRIFLCFYTEARGGHNCASIRGTGFITVAPLLCFNTEPRGSLL